MSNCNVLDILDKYNFTLKRPNLIIIIKSYKVSLKTKLLDWRILYLTIKDCRNK